jgi:hypothetical protein
MSILHVNQIAGALERQFNNMIDLSDVTANVDERRKCFLTRSLAAFAISQLAGIPPEEAAKSVTDGTSDNGVDALHYDRASKKMYVVQAKWHSDGNGSFERADMLKFTKGFEDLANIRMDRFNEKVRAKESMIKEAFHDDKANYILVPIYTGAQDLAVEPKQDLQDCLDQYNETADPEAYPLLQTRVLKQSDVHGLVARGTQGAPIDLEVALFQWGEASDPFSIYGQVAASDVATWWKTHYPQIVSQNIRMFLGGDTEVNIGLHHTLLADPEHFWHFNNGITAICREIRPKLAGGKSKESGFFNCYDVRIVNGAQTAGSIASAHERSPNDIERARVHVRFIAVGNDAESGLGDAITRATNTQNRINRQDFVALDPEQQRIRTELTIDGVTYNYKSGEGTVRDAQTSDIEEATIALACASTDLAHSTQAKREIGRLWEHTSKSPYKALFNASLSGIKMWQCIQIMRQIDLSLQAKLPSLTGRDTGFVVHGNRCIAHIVFQRFPPTLMVGHSSLPADIATQIATIVDDTFARLRTKSDLLYPQAYLAQLFKNQKKLTEILSAMNISVGAH